MHTATIRARTATLPSLFLLCFALIALGGCELAEDADATDTASTSDATSDTSGGGGDVEDDTFTPTTSCRPPAAEDRARMVVVSHPFDGADGSYEVFTLSTSGDLSSTGQRFNMGYASAGQVVFTPDGQVGLVAQSGGSIGVFSATSAGEVSVIDPAFTGSFTASRVVMHPSGEHAYVIDRNTRDNGGGVYRIDIDCDTGALTDAGLVIAGHAIYDMAWYDDAATKAIVAGDSVLDASVGSNGLFIVELEQGSLLETESIFSFPETTMSDVAVTADRRYALLGDDSVFAGTDPNSVAVVGINGDALSLLQTLPVEDPTMILPSPFNDAALVVSGFGEDLVVLRRTSDNATPFSLQGSLGVSDLGLPISATMVTRGSLAGTVIVAEETALRRVRFSGNGAVSNVGATSTGAGDASVNGAIGVQP